MRTVIIRNGTGYQPRDPKAFEMAMGYAAVWAMGPSELLTLTFVEVSIHSDGNLAVAYWRNAEEAEKPGRPSFMMFGKQDSDGSYEFHS